MDAAARVKVALLADWGGRRKGSYVELVPALAARLVARGFAQYPRGHRPPADDAAAASPAPAEPSAAPSVPDAPRRRGRPRRAQ